MDFGKDESINTTISHDVHINTTDKEEFTAYLKNTTLNLNTSIEILHTIQNKFGILDRFDIIRNLSIDFDEIASSDTNFLKFLKIFGKCIECDVFDSIVGIIESGFSRNTHNENIKALKSFELIPENREITNILHKITNENDTEAMTFAVQNSYATIPNDSWLWYIPQDVTNFMIECGVDCTHKVPPRQLMNNLSYIKNFLKNPRFDVNAKGYRNDTALIIASSMGCHEVVKLLLTIHGIDVNAKDYENGTALHYASLHGHYEVVKLLLEVPGIDVNSRNKYNKTALHYASSHGHQEIVKLLLTVPGIDVNAKDDKNRTALSLATEYGKHEVTKLLVTVPGIEDNISDWLSRHIFIC